MAYGREDGQDADRHDELPDSRNAYRRVSLARRRVVLLAAGGAGAVALLAFLLWLAMRLVNGRPF